MMKKAMIGAIALMATTGIARADVKAGVDAWSRGDFKKAVAEWRGPALAGDADAQFNLGQAYKLGRGVPADLPLAIDWFRKAAIQGHAQAQDNYGLALFQEGKKGDALPWLEKSVARDEKRTELVLGTMLFNGDAVTKDWTRAYALVTRSSQQGVSQASQTLTQMDQYIAADQRQQGVQMASRIEADGRVARLAQQTAAKSPVRTAALDLPPPPVKASKNPPVPGKPEPRPTAPHPTPVAKPPAAATKAVAASGGSWRIQLGAFRDEGNANALWSKVGAKTGGAVSYVKAGAITKLQATGFASRTAAQSACGKASVACVVVAP